MNLKVNGKAPERPDEIMDYRKSPMMLISEISRLMGDKIREKGVDNPIQQKSGRLLLMELAKKDGRTQLDLVNATHLKAPTISVALQKMEKDGYVLRKPDEYDLRATRVFLTEKGREIDDRIRKRIHEEEALAMVDLTESEYETLVKLLTKIKGSILKDSEKDGDLY
ncbi:MAG: MarR family transcriptional regulator [Clostridia bacterium]|nr:MarR family transcriptional regulator [Clostridia bacterium]